MLDHMLVAVNAVLPSFLIIALGLFVRRRGMLDDKSLGKFNSVAFRVFLPFQIFKNIYDAPIGVAFDPKLILFIFFGLILAGGFALLIAALTESRRDRRGVMAQGMFRANYVLLGLPLVQSLFGDAGTGLASLMIAVNIPIYNVLAVIFLELYAGGKVDVRKMLRDIVTNPLIDATAVGLLAKAVNLPVYAFPAFASALQSLAAVATPLCLFILGGSFAPAGIKDYARSLWITVAFKLAVIPGLALAAAAAIGIRGVGLGVVMMSFGAPTAVNSYTMARELGGDGDLAASIVVIGTALSCLTLFGWIVLLKSLGLF
ncbi:MAG: AEC family transporter [Oscillospiraceae bacterium]|nr:AEC family transporter [Oscillospiraceae bacterium]